MTFRPALKFYGAEPLSYQSSGCVCGWYLLNGKIVTTIAYFHRLPKVLFVVSKFSQYLLDISYGWILVNDKSSEPSQAVIVAKQVRKNHPVL